MLCWCSRSNSEVQFRICRWRPVVFAASISCFLSEVSVYCLGLTLSDPKGGWFKGEVQGSLGEP